MKARFQLERGGRVARVFLAAPRANILDAAMVTELDQIFERLEKERELRAIVIEGEGPHFSYGASVEEHLPDQIEGALARLGGLLRRVAAAPAVTIAAVRGLCLGGGFELALACDLIVAEEEAELGLPEIKLGVFPPAGCALLPVRIGVAGASSLVLTGESWTGHQALQQGLVARMAPEGSLGPAIDGFLDETFVPRSAASLRHATRAVRTKIIDALYEDLPKLETLYLQELMKESDAREGIRAFLERREAKWVRPEVPV